MQRHSVNDMSCQHCVAALTEAIERAEPRAAVKIDLTSKTVEVDGDIGDEAIAALFRHSVVHVLTEAWQE